MSTHEWRPPLRPPLERAGSRSDTDGQHPFAGAGAAPSLVCRVYRAPAGLAGAPDVDQLRRALTDPSDTGNSRGDDGDPGRN